MTDSAGIGHSSKLIVSIFFCFSHLAINSPAPSSLATSLDTALPLLVKAKLSSVISAHFDVGLMSVNLNMSDWLQE